MIITVKTKAISCLSSKIVGIANDWHGPLKKQKFKKINNKSKINNITPSY